MMNEIKDAPVVANPSKPKSRRWMALAFIIGVAVLFRLGIMVLHNQDSVRQNDNKWAIVSCHAHQGTWVPAPPPAEYGGTCL